MFELLFHYSSMLQISRRFFGKFVALILSFVSLRRLHARPGEAESSDESSVCPDVLTKWENLLNAPSPPYIWVQGVYNSNPNFYSQATLAILIPVTQSKDSYINIVYLVRSSGKNHEVLSLRYIAYSDQLQNGFAPYIIFDNVDLMAPGSYSIIYSVRTPSEDQGYAYSFSDANLKISKLNDPTRLGPYIKDDLMKATFGIVSTPIEYISTISAEKLKLYSLNARLSAIEANGAFEITVFFPHLDVNQGNYNRYFIATDPVGRILGVTKRLAPNPDETSTTIRAITDQDRIKWAITSDQIAKINDCPYVMIFCDDLKVICKTILTMY